MIVTMKQYKIAAILMIIHGGLMELSVCLALIPLDGDERDLRRYSNNWRHWLTEK